MQTIDSFFYKRKKWNGMEHEALKIKAFSRK